MIALARMHPVQLVLGGILVAEELATKGGQLSLAVLCEQAAAWASVTRGVFRAIAADAATGRMEVRELLGDHEASDADIDQIDARFASIERKALTGRIDR